MPGFSSTESRSPRPIPPKRPFADFDESDPSLPQPGTTKRLRIETEEAEQGVKTIQQQPKPHPLKRPHAHASFLEDLVDPLSSIPLSSIPLSSIPAPKRYRPESVDSFVTQWIESTSGPESYRERHCRSDTLLSYSDRDIIPRRLTKSAPNMEYRWDTDGFALPPIPTSTRSHSYRANAEDDPRVSSYATSITPSDISGASTGSSRKRGLVEDPNYRRLNLAANNIYIRSSREQYPEHIADLVNHIREDRDSPSPSLDEVWQDIGLENLEMGTGEADVEDYFRDKIFPKPAPFDSLKRIDRNPMAKHTVPDIGSKLKVSPPVPDMLFGYTDEAFPQQQAQLISIGNELVANSQGLICPFFVVEFKADGPSRAGGLWVATNQCLGGSVSCVNIAERLNRQLRQCKSDKVQTIDSTAFSIAMSGTEARLYISWKHDELKYYTQKVDSFLLQKPKDYVEFRKYVRNIIDWGKGQRLNEIRALLDGLLEENRKTASQLAKSRPPPSDDSASNSHKRRFYLSRDTYTSQIVPG